MTPAGAVLPPPLGPLAWPLDEAAFAPPPDRAAVLPKISIVTPSYNQGRYLEATLRSVLAQGYPNLEYFVVDGGSSDHSVEIVRHYERHLSGWVSERDEGQSHAIEKGLARCTGEWFIWLNSDDLLAPGALWAVAAAGVDADVVAGSTHHFADDGLRYLRNSRRIDARSMVLEPMNSGIRWHQTAFWTRRAPLAAIGLNRRLHYVFDYELMIRYLLANPRVRVLDRTLSYFRLHPSSKTVSQGERFRDEAITVYRALAEEPAFAALAPDLDRAARGVEWLRRIDRLLDERTTPRLARLAEIVRGARADPAARCTKNTRRAARRILLYGGQRSGHG